MINLVDYSSSDTEEDERVNQPQQVNTKKVAVKLPMLLQVDRSNSNENNSSADHQMRVRSIPHVEGNWATHVFIDCPLSERLQESVTSLTKSLTNVHLVDSVHVSLSRTFILKFHWIDSFFSSLRDKLRRFPKFQLQFSSDVVFLSNDEKTRHFACVLISEWCNQNMCLIIKKVDESLQEFNLPVYYEEPSFHISLLWKLSEFTDDEKRKISSTISDLKGNQEDLLKLPVDRISCKSGNKLMEILL